MTSFFCIASRWMPLRRPVFRSFSALIILPLLLTTGCNGLLSRTTSIEPVSPEPSPTVVQTHADDTSASVDATQTQIVIPTRVDTEPHAISAVIEQPMEAEYADIWERIRAGFVLSHETDRKRVLSELKWFVNHPEYVERVTRRAEPHLHYIVEEIERRGLPMELALLPIVESAYDPFAYSHGRASGLWQFIPSTARVYDLRIDWWYDGRRDVRASTNAALDYLTYLNDLFDGDWLLALAAYNAGQGNVLSFIRASKLPREEADFWSLTVLKETAAYVPRLLAISEIVAKADHYHMNLPATPNTPQWQVVALGGQLDLHKAATLAEMPVGELYNLNAGFNQWATHPEGPHELIIPISKAENFKAALAALSPNDRLSWQRHKVRSGESLGSIAQNYNTSIDTIRTVNGLKGNLIIAGKHLLIPAANATVDYEMTQTDRLQQQQDKYAKKYAGQLVYVVQPGDSFWEIARTHNVGMRELAKWNGMGTTTVLRPGQELVIYKKAAAKPVSQRALPVKPQKIRKLHYRVRKGESLALIAAKFNVSVSNIKSWNQALDVNQYIHPGDRLTLFVNVTGMIN